MSHPPYLKPHFEADLLALGEVRSVPSHELGRVDEEPGRPVVLTDALGSSAIVLFQELPDGDLGETLRTGNAQRPAERHMDDGGIHITAANHTLSLPNPYGLMAYFPEAADGKGDASFYTMPEFDFTLPHASRYVTEQEAKDLLIETAISLPGGLFVSRPEAEMAHHAYHEGKSMAQMRVEDYAPSAMPLVKVSVDPLTTEGSFALLDAVPITRGSTIQRLSYTGRAAMTGVLKNLPAYTHGDNNSIMQLMSIAPGQVDLAGDNGVFAYSYVDRGAFSYDDLIRMIRVKEGASGQDALPSFEQKVGIHKALETGLIGADALIYAPALATPILYRALTEAPDTPYFQNLRRELGPAFGQESDLITRARADAHSAWQAVLANQVKVEPVATGLDQVATRAGIRRKTRATITLHDAGAVYVAGDGNIVIH